MLKRILISFISVASFFNCQSQQFTVSVDKPQPVVYLGLDNYISCTVEKYTCDSVFLTTDNGMITKIGGNHYVYRPQKIADSKIFVSVKENGVSRTVGNYVVLIRKIPDPSATIGGLSGGTISIGNLKAQAGVGAYIQGSIGIEVRYSVIEFQLSISRKQETIFSEINDGNAFKPQIKEALQALQKGDNVIVSSIKVIKPDGEIVTVKPLEFMIEE